MPVGQTGLSATEGAAFGLFPIMWIVVMAIWIYNMTVETGHFAVLRRSFGAISDDQRLAIGAAAVGLVGREGDLFRKVLGWSLLLVLIMCVLVYLQSTAVLDWMVVE
jgi:L-lactate permease